VQYNQNTDEGSIYSFSGRIIQGSESNKIIYTTKISTLGGGIPSTPTPSTSSTQAKEGEIIIHIAEGASEPQNFDFTAQGYILQNKFISPNRISTIPGTTLTFVNDDTVSHNISSGKRDTNSRAGSPYIPDGKIDSGDIMPGKSWSVTIDEIGFIALFDRDYTYITMDVVVFPDIESDILKAKKDTKTPFN